MTLQLSNPIEEATITDQEGSQASFEGIEITSATLTVTAKDADIPLGSSAPYDIAPLCVFDALDLKEKYETDLPVAIVAEGSVAPIAEASAEATVVESDVALEKEETTKTSVEASAEAEPILPTCTITLRVTYKPSKEDQQGELSELLNKCSLRKREALENLRKASTQLARAGSSRSTGAKPAVKPGFLNKKKNEPKLTKLYNRYFGPESVARRGLGMMMAAKNYILFFGSCALFHFQGQMLALPPPV